MNSLDTLNIALALINFIFLISIYGKNSKVSKNRKIIYAIFAISNNHIIHVDNSYFESQDEAIDVMDDLSSNPNNEELNFIVLPIYSKKQKSNERNYRERI